MLKTIGYLISSVSVLLLGIVAWPSTADEPAMRLCLTGGMVTSVLGMFFRWMSFQKDEKPAGKQPRAG